MKRKTRARKRDRLLPGWVGWSGLSVLMVLVALTGCSNINSLWGGAYSQAEVLDAGEGMQEAAVVGGYASDAEQPQATHADLPVQSEPPQTMPLPADTQSPPAQAALSQSTSSPEQPLPSSSEPPESEAEEAANWIALTFDDGPDGKYTPQVLDILKEYDVKATFFLVGTQVEKYPEVAKRIVEEGHSIGNHSWSHKDLSKMTAKALDDQVKRTQEAIADATGVVPALVRAPYGALSEKFIQYLHDLKLLHVYWTIDPRDWAGTSVADMHSIIVEHAKPGGVILLHSFGGRKNALDHTLELLPLIIEDLRQEGYEFATVEQMIETKAVIASAIK